MRSSHRTWACYGKEKHNKLSGNMMHYTILTEPHSKLPNVFKQLSINFHFRQSHLRSIVMVP